MTSHGPSTRAVCSDAAESTRCATGSKPATRSARTASAASSRESSTIRTRSWGFTATCDTASLDPGFGSSHLGGEFVQQEPVEPEIGHGLGELPELDRLADIAVDAEGVAADQI